jgi:sugar phosphate isomerase/epimerase
MKKPISLQLYTVREDCAKDFFGTIREVASIGYKGVEFAGLHGADTREVAKLLRELGLRVSSSHVSLPTPENINQLVDQEKMLGNDLLIAGLGPDSFKTTDDCKRSAARFQEASQLAIDNGMRFGCHNHWWEFHKVDGKRAFDILMEEAPDLQSELDIYWAAYGGDDPAAVVHQYRSRIPVLHVKDGTLEKDQPHLPVGYGKLDIAGIINAADPNTLDWLIVELDDFAGVMMEAVSVSFHYLVDHGLGEGNH